MKQSKDEEGEKSMKIENSAREKEGKMVVERRREVEKSQSSQRKRNEWARAIPVETKTKRGKARLVGFVTVEVWHRKLRS